MQLMFLGSSLLVWSNYIIYLGFYTGVECLSCVYLFCHLFVSVAANELFISYCVLCKGLPGGSDSKNLPAVLETWLDSGLGREWLHTSVFCRNKSMQLRVGHNWVTNVLAFHLGYKIYCLPVYFVAPELATGSFHLALCAFLPSSHQCVFFCFVFEHFLTFWYYRML